MVAQSQEFVLQCLSFYFLSQEVVCGFLSEALAGSHTAVHTIFYEVDDEDGLIAIPGKYADRGQTAECLKQMARAVNGRFHWYRSGGEAWNPHFLSVELYFLCKISLVRKQIPTDGELIA